MSDCQIVRLYLVVQVRGQTIHPSQIYILYFRPGENKTSTKSRAEVVEDTQKWVQKI